MDTTPWTVTEKAAMCAALKLYGNSWYSIFQSGLIPGRSIRSISSHGRRVLDSDPHLMERCTDTICVGGFLWSQKENEFLFERLGQEQNQWGPNYDSITDDLNNADLDAPTKRTVSAVCSHIKAMMDRDARWRDLFDSKFKLSSCKHWTESDLLWLELGMRRCRSFDEIYCRGYLPERSKGAIRKKWEDLVNDKARRYDQAVRDKWSELGRIMRGWTQIMCKKRKLLQRGSKQKRRKFSVDYYARRMGMIREREEEWVDSVLQHLKKNPIMVKKSLMPICTPASWSDYREKHLEIVFEGRVIAFPTREWKLIVNGMIRRDRWSDRWSHPRFFKVFHGDPWYYKV